MYLNTIHCGDAVEYLRTLPEGCVNCVATSPPYYGLRDYGVEGQIGLEETLPEFLEKLRTLFAEVRRVLRDDGVMWVNMGDSYTGGGRGSGSGKQTTNEGSLINTRSADLPAKNLLGVPWRLAFALQDDGWILRSDCIWHKPSVMPEPVTDRPTKSHEYVFLLTKSPRYWYDADAVREPVTDATIRRYQTGWNGNRNRGDPGGGKQNSHNFFGTETAQRNIEMGRNMRTVWTLSAEPNAFAHFAAFPQKLVRRCILAGCPREVCAECGAPYVREVDRTPIMTGTPSSNLKQSQLRPNKSGNQYKYGEVGYLAVTTLGFSPTCTCNASTRPGVVLDPFMGSGTTALVARAEGRDFLGCDLNPEYVAMAEKRLAIPYTPRLFFDDAFELGGGGG